MSLLISFGLSTFLISRMMDLGHYVCYNSEVKIYMYFFILRIFLCWFNFLCYVLNKLYTTTYLRSEIIGVFVFMVGVRLGCLLVSKGLF